ncbi:mitochondrial thiamine pyrophosphate carrier [Anthonomus grandis grandis]|uniref:mitochondrial thiamine pyrophosphate carrier n=1 Tax=Anthonomus grandis grandis TaxID=2921223 RepID=UPI0021662F97|nr:mitochondrial thiamine pyrophosphate carrier [Anthonomus grandis grandis]XP_050301588.1 mitochondrial thiamine pyrophosphate carrier [Anthonomus grandis grandis]
MVGWSTSHKNLNQFDFMVAGGISGFITRAICQPLDVLKIRFQLQVEPISENAHTAKYRSVPQAITLILKEEGVKAFWKGHVPAQWLSVSYGVVQYWSYEILVRNVSKNLDISPHWIPVVNFSCGSIAGSVATLVSFPFDVVRTRFVAQSEHKKVYHTMLSATIKIYQTEGPLVLFRGLWPTILQVGPHAGAQFMFYRMFHDLYNRISKSESTTFTSSVFAGSLAGLCAKTVIYPFDLVKKRLQIQGFGYAREQFGQHFTCRGLTDCLKKIYKIEGPWGYFKGLSPSLIKAVCTTALHFSSYEMICKFLVLIREKS